MQVAIVEDELSNSQLLQKYLTRFSKDFSTEIHSVSYSGGIDFLNSFQPVWDLILLDIEMPIINGVEVAREIRKIDSEVIIIFITQTAQYALDGYKVNAFDYILKPVNYYALSMKLQDVTRILTTRQHSFLIINNQSGTLKLNLKNLRYVEVSNHTLYYYTDKEFFPSTSSSSLKRLSQELKTYGFSRCHQGYLVNLHYVTGYEKKNIFVGNDILPISRTYYKTFLQDLLTYWKGRKE